MKNRKKLVEAIEDYFWEFVEAVNWAEAKHMDRIDSIACKLFTKYNNPFELVALQMFVNQLTVALAVQIKDKIELPFYPHTVFNPDLGVEMDVKPEDELAAISLHIVGLGKEQYYTYLQAPEKITQNLKVYSWRFWLIFTHLKELIGTNN